MPNWIMYGPSWQTLMSWISEAAGTMWIIEISSIPAYLFLDCYFRFPFLKPGPSQMYMAYHISIGNLDWFKAAHFQPVLVKMWSGLLSIQCISASPNLNLVDFHTKEYNSPGLAWWKISFVTMMLATYTADETWKGQMPSGIKSKSISTGK